MTTERGTLEERRAAEQEAHRRTWEQMLEQHPTDREHAHMLTLVVYDSVRPTITCPGREYCGLWYSDPASPGGGMCGVKLECSEVGSEFLEWQVGPEFVPSTNPFPIGFKWHGGGDDDPPEIEWWPLPTEQGLPEVRCDAKLYHGPGHQSAARCERTGYHVVHEATYGSERRRGQWKGDEGMTGFWDEPPIDPEDE